MNKKIFMILIPVILVGCLPRVAVKDSLFFSDKEREVFLKDECNPLMGALVNKSDDSVKIQIYKKKEDDSYKLIDEIILKRRLENNAVCKKGNALYLKYFLLPDYGTYILSMIVVYKEIVDGEETTFVNRKNQKFTITRENQCDLNLKIGWGFEIVN